MRTLSVVVGVLLLLAALSCNASPRGGIPSKCCFNFFGQQIPEAFVLSIQKTHVRCYSKAFVIKTSIGEVCVKQAEWAQAIYNKRSAPSPSPLSK